MVRLHCWQAWNFVRVQNQVPLDLLNPVGLNSPLSLSPLTKGMGGAGVLQLHRKTKAAAFSAARSSPPPKKRGFPSFKFAPTHPPLSHLSSPSAQSLRRFASQRHTISGLTGAPTWDSFAEIGLTRHAERAAWPVPQRKVPGLDQTACSPFGYLRAKGTSSFALSKYSD